MSGEDPFPSTVADPLLGAEDMLHVSEDAFVSGSVAFKSLVVQVTDPSSVIVLSKGPAPWAMTGGMPPVWEKVITTLPCPVFAPAVLFWLVPEL